LHLEDGNLKLSKIEWFVIIGNLAISGIFVYMFVALPIETTEEIVFLTTEDILLPIFVIGGIIVAFLILSWLSVRTKEKIKYEEA